MLLLSSDKRLFGGRTYTRDVYVNRNGRFRITLPSSVRRLTGLRYVEGASLADAVEAEKCAFVTARENSSAAEEVLLYKFDSSRDGRESSGPPKLRLLAARYKLRTFPLAAASERLRFTYVDSSLPCCCLSSYGWRLEALPRVLWSKEREQYLLKLGQDIDGMAEKFNLALDPARFDEAMTDGLPLKTE